MKTRWIAVAVTVLILCLSACIPIDPNDTGATNPNTCPYGVMVDGRVYSTFFEPAQVPEDVQIAGTIQSRSTDISSMPTENDTANFEVGEGLPYAFVDGVLIIQQDGQWYLCRLLER